jgi:hypothetical protein
MKAQIIPISFLLISISLIIIGFIFYNVFYGKKYEEKILSIRILDAARSVIENAKNYLKISLVYSSLQAMREQAASGGSVGAAPWICNRPNPLPVETSKRCLENYTSYYLTIYGSEFNTTLPLNVYLKNFSSLIYQVERSGVLRGLYDEGNFYVNASGASISITGENLGLLEGINISELITKNRFWYMFRIFYEWASQDVFSPCICSNVGCGCSSSSQEETCSSCLQASEYCAEYALRVLQSKFDEYVKCERSNVCCMQGIGPPCLPPSDCLSWRNRCSRGCEHSCSPPPLYSTYQNLQQYETALSSSECPTGTFCSGVSECVGLGGTCTGSCSLGCCCSATTTTTTTRPSCPAGTTCVDRVICGQAGGSCVSSCGSYECCCSLTTTYTTTTTITSTTITTTLTTTTITTTTPLVCRAYYWHEGRFSSAHIFTCKDYKYYISSPKGPKPLTFSVSAYAYFRDQDVCKSLVECDCSQASSCDECRPIGPACTKCFNVG